VKTNENLFFTAIKIISIEWIGDVLYFPLWWYSKGLKKVGLWYAYTIRDIENRLGVWIWLKNLFVPMYGQQDWQGRLISVFMRIIQIIARSISFLVSFVVTFAFVLLWIIAPLFIIYEILLNFVAHSSANIL
jgi:hypothetical protein